VGEAHSATTLTAGANLAAAAPDQVLVGLLRLQTMVLANPPPLTGLRKMVDMLYANIGTTRVAVGIPDGNGGLVRYLAHAGRPERRHETVVTEATPMAAMAMETGQLVQVTHMQGDAAHACVHVPIMGAQRALGFFGIAIGGRVPIETWRAEAVWATSDLMALLLLDLEETSAGGVRSESPLGALTPRQCDVLFDLVEYGEGNAAIGQRLGLSAKTVKIHLMAAYRQLGVHSRADAMRIVLTRHADWLARQRKARRGRSGAV
jgi:DNA-binding CsgD family transcriptional regulator